MGDSQDNQEDTHPNAGRDSGYVAPVGEDIVNRLTILLATLETKLLTSNQSIGVRIDQTIQQQDQRFGYVLNQLGAFFEKEDTRHDAYSGELQVIVDGLGGLRADVQQSAAETARRLEKHDEDIEALTLVVAEHKADHDTRITSLEDYRADMQALRDALAALSARIDSALPTEADQALSTELRGSEAARPSDGD